MRKISFSNDGIYHIFNRGVDKRTIFLEDGDYFRFIHDLYEFNDESPAENIYYKTSSLQSYDVGNRKIQKKVRTLLVDIIAFCIMPNHFHLLVKQRVENGITLFMKKLGGGYANYFNTKNERSGTLFQGRFQAVPIDTDEYLTYIPFYIHANPIELYDPGCKESGFSKNKKDVLHFLESYRWSNFPDCIGKKNFPSVTQRDFILNYFGGPLQYKKYMLNWMDRFASSKISANTTTKIEVSDRDMRDITLD
ncbi:MAG: transposase [Candidatus Paceibacterota bacterium]